jgi:hypothetical protein|tara:strand:- start:1723 stop:2364 length:642 start_codon:yes stop_codon:yes gene_type:complete
MVEPVTILTGIALVKKSVDFVKQQIETCNDIGDIIGHIDKAMTGEQQVIKARDKSGADPFAVGTVAQEIIDAKLAREQLNDLRNLVNYRFGPGTWEFILQERKKRIDAQKQAIKEAKAAKLRKQQEIAEYIKYGFITVAVILFISVAIGITIKFFVSATNKVYAHNVEQDDGSCKLYDYKYFLICMNEGRGYADTELYLDYQRKKDNWIIEKD